MFQNVDKEGLIAEEVLAGEIMPVENESQGDIGASMLDPVVLAPNLMDTIHFPQVVRPNEVSGHSSNMAGEAHAQFHRLVHLCLCGFRHRKSWVSHLRWNMSSVHRSLHHIPIRTHQTTSTLQFIVRCLTSRKSQQHIRRSSLPSLRRRSWS